MSIGPAYVEGRAGPNTLDGVREDPDRRDRPTVEWQYEDENRPEPLWATSLAREPRRVEDVPRPPAPEPVRDTPAPEQGPPLVGVRVLAAVALAGLVVVLTASLVGRNSFSIGDVPSAWGDVKMRCHTARFEQDGRAVELFRCHAVGGGTLPAGLYESPESLWTSDVTRIDARANEIRIFPDGKLVGWAAY
jgi:hypothetical protein